MKETTTPTESGSLIEDTDMIDADGDAVFRTCEEEEGISAVPHTSFGILEDPKFSGLTQSFHSRVFFSDVS